ncbi:hypothetical protein MSAN_01405600 [Mycena sanguinolenta]|uniref:BAH domain-containing protein n=1 Tax=Mycena sanguinolenta TaxID=230812 RepID=A0A8H7CY63_9AGAR|nr:hypothetical protein MSAN_01405600 [Mycena sanguinolenta]
MGTDEAVWQFLGSAFLLDTGNPNKHLGKVLDDEGQPVVFSLGQTAAIFPSKIKVGTQLPLRKHWFGKILAIRARTWQPSKKVKPARTPAQKETQDPDVWVKINWFYSPTDVSKKIPGFQARHCSEFERIYSDHSDIVSALTFEAPIQVLKFCEDDPDQNDIPDSSFFYRYFLKTSSKKYELLVMQSSEHPEDLCLCHCPYNLRDTDLLRVMHMCPRPSCRRFYHRSCLLEFGYWGPTTDPFLRLLSCPDTDQAPSQLLSHKARSATFPSSTTTDVQLPHDLLTFAAQPIVRGAALPALGITGNARDIVYARRLVYAACQGITVPDSWHDDFDLASVPVDFCLRVEETGESCMFACPNCRGPI